jgi:hypothetical protein
VVEVVEGPDDGGNDGEEAREIEERGESLLEGVWGDERSGGDEAGGW